jgi:glycosyltransferase involved in cell wall biosynthesis
VALSVLQVAYPFAPVDADPVGGAEQVLAQLDRALVAAGHRSWVVAAAGSRVAGTLVPVDVPLGDGRPLEPADEHRARAAFAATVADVVRRRHVDLVHLHGLDFDAYLPPPGPPVLVTLHLPLAWYSPLALSPRRPDTWLVPVSSAQARTAPAGVALLPPVTNGVDLAVPRLTKRGYALVLGRVCREKGFHDALEAAHRADATLLAAGRVFPWAEHRRYFEVEVAPRLDRRRRWLGPVGGPRKRRLLAAARCVLLPSRAPETSSLVAMEALAAGTPVIAYRAGALPDIVDDGRTGFLVDDVAGIASALGRVDRLDPDDCRRAAAHRFAVGRTTAAYLALYRSIAAGRHRAVPEERWGSPSGRPA